MPLHAGAVSQPISGRSTNNFICDLSESSKPSNMGHMLPYSLSELALRPPGTNKHGRPTRSYYDSQAVLALVGVGEASPE